MQMHRLDSAGFGSELKNQLYFRQMMLEASGHRFARVLEYVSQRRLFGPPSLVEIFTCFDVLNEIIQPPKNQYHFRGLPSKKRENLLTYRSHVVNGLFTDYSHAVQAAPWLEDNASSSRARSSTVHPWEI
jgi:hypothetical protein